MLNSKNLGVLLLSLALLIGWMSVFIVDERQNAILFRLGKIVRADYKPGIHWMVPLINNVRKFDKRILTLDTRPEQILTGEKKNVLVDYFVKWRIRDVEAYYLAYGGIEQRASARMSEIVNDGLQSEFDKRTIRQVVTDDRVIIMESLTKRANDEMGQFGIEVVDVRIKQIELPPGVREFVFKRMRTERDRIAKDHRAKGERESLIIRARADRKRIELFAEAKRKAEEIRGAGDAIATETYANAYGKDAEFYEFYRSLLAYKNTFNSKDDVLVLEPDSEFFKYFGGSKLQR